MDTSFINEQNELSIDTNNQETINKQYDVYEKEIEYLKTQLIRINNNLFILNSKKSTFEQTFSQWNLSNKIFNNLEEREIFFNHLKEEYLRINLLVSDANIISNEMQKETIYKVILQIPISYLKPNERSISNLCEPLIQIKRQNLPIQIWNIEKFELKLNDMKDIYYQWKISENKTDLLIEQLKQNDPFFDIEEYNSFIGIANIHLKALFYDSKLDYIVPIINTQGEISGSLHVVLEQTGLSSMKKSSNFHINSMINGSISEGISLDTNEQSLSNHSNSHNSLEDEGIVESTLLSNNKNDQITVKFSIKEVKNLLQINAENIVCQYTFINPKLDDIVISIKRTDEDIEKKPHIFSFNHEKEYTFPITDDFITTCLESAISIEVWYQNNSKSLSTENNKYNQHDAEIRLLKKQWKEVKRHIQYSIEIHEMDGSGQWEPVEVGIQQKLISGGIYRLKQGQSKRIVAHVRVLPHVNQVPLVLHAIRTVEIGSISTRKVDAPRQLDSYQDKELECLRNEWLNLIEKRKFYIESEVKKINQQINKTANDIERETILLEQLIRLAEERNIAEFPPSGSGIPGSPPGWNLPPTIEIHRPLIFLNLDLANKNILNNKAGLTAILTEENKTNMFPLSLIQHESKQDDKGSISMIRVTAQWNPSIHEAVAINQVTSNDTIVYMIVKIIIIISQPVDIELVLRKRIAVTISKNENWWSGKIIKNFLGYNKYNRTSVVYEIISHIPTSIRKIENEINPQLITDSDYLSENSIEKFLQYASIIDKLLLVDKLRQEVLLAENSSKEQIIRKTISTPNITYQKGNKNLSISSRKSRDENFNNQSSLYPSYTHHQTIESSSQPELNILNLNSNENNSYFESSPPSYKSRKSFIKDEQIQPIRTATIQFPHPINIDDNKQEINENILEERYSRNSIQRIESPSKQIIEDNNNNNNNNEKYSIGSRVIVNTGHSILDEPGIIRFIGNIYISKGIWYGIELEKKIGKNNGSLNGHFYFECPNEYGIFVRDDKIRLTNN